MNILDNIKDNLMQGLNANDLGLHFFITTEMGSYKKPDRVGNKIIDYINGQLTVINSSTLPTQGLEVSTQTIQLSLAIPLRTTVSNESVIVKNVRTVLEQYLSQNRVIVIEQNNKSLVCALNYSLPNTGSVDQRSGIGTFLELTAMLYVSCIENGLNSIERRYYLNGELLPYTSATRSRVPLTESNSFSGVSSIGQGKNIMQSTAIGFDLNVVALDPNQSLASKAIQRYLDIGGLNEVLKLKVESGVGDELISNEYDVIFGQVSEISEGVQNVGYKLSFIEAATEVLLDVEGDDENGG